MLFRSRFMISMAKNWVPLLIATLSLDEKLLAGTLPKLNAANVLATVWLSLKSGLIWRRRSRKSND